MIETLCYGRKPRDAAAIMAAAAAGVDSASIDGTVRKLTSFFYLVDTLSLLML